FVRLLRHWKRVSRYDRPDAWVRKVALREAIRLSKRAYRASSMEAMPEGSVTTVPTDVDLMRAVGSLSTSQRAAVVLFYFEDRPVAQIAEILDCSSSAAKVHLHRARKR